jgi:hypothetical protein
MKHIENIENDYIIGKISCRISSVNTVYVQFLHKEMNENAGVIDMKGAPLMVSGDIAYTEKGYTFFAKEIVLMHDVADK